MSAKTVILDQDLLVAYVDGELPPERQAEVEAALVHDAQAWESVRLLRLSASAAARAFAPVLAEPVPARLLAAAGQGDANRTFTGLRSHSRRVGWFLPLAASLAALAIGIGAGYSLRGDGTTAGGGYAPAAVPAADSLAQRFESALLAALEKGSEGESFTYESQNVGEGKVELGRAFSTGFGSGCREFHREETRAGAHRQDNGLACRGADKSWSVMILPNAG